MKTDPIDREMVRQKLWETCNDTHPGKMCKFAEYLEDIINDIPSIPENSCEAHTIITENLALPAFSCNKCNGEWRAVSYEYCPWCGRKIKYGLNNYKED